LLVRRWRSQQQVADEIKHQTTTAEGVLWPAVIDYDTFNASFPCLKTARLWNSQDRWS
jgi:hypothetical protein